MFNPELIFYPFTMAMRALIWCISMITGNIAYLIGLSIRYSFFALRALFRIIKTKLANRSQAQEVQRSVQD